MKAGMKCLIELFYQSIVQNEPPPIPYREILVTARIMDSIFDQVGSKRLAASYEALVSEDPFPAEMGLRSAEFKGFRPRSDVGHANLTSGTASKS